MQRKDLKTYSCRRGPYTSQYQFYLQNLIAVFYFQENNKHTKKPVNRFLHDGLY